MAMPQSKNIYFSRHGERIDSIDKTWINTTTRPHDPPLSPYGFHQAQELALYIASIQPRITHIYVSPFLRTIQTALEVVRQLNKNISSPNEITKIRVEPGVGEYYGYYVDVEWNEHSMFRPWNELIEISSDTAEYFDQDYKSIITDDYYLRTKVETRQHLRDRLKQVLKCTLDAHGSDCNILIVTHAAALIEGVRALLTINTEQSQRVITKEKIKIVEKEEENNVVAWDMSPIRAGVCSLTHIELIDDKWNLSKHGLTSYLSKGEQHLWHFPEDKALYKTTK